MRRTLDDTPFLLPTGLAADWAGIPEDAIIRAIEDGRLDWQRIGGTTFVALEHVEALAEIPPGDDPLTLCNRPGAVLFTLSQSRDPGNGCQTVPGSAGEALGGRADGSYPIDGDLDPALCREDRSQR